LNDVLFLLGYLDYLRSIRFLITCFPTPSGFFPLTDVPFFSISESLACIRQFMFQSTPQQFSFFLHLPFCSEPLSTFRPFFPGRADMANSVDLAFGPGPFYLSPPGVSPLSSIGDFEKEAIVFITNHPPRLFLLSLHFARLAMLVSHFPEKELAIQIFSPSLAQL